MDNMYEMCVKNSKQNNYKTVKTKIEMLRRKLKKTICVIYFVIRFLLTSNRMIVHVPST